MVPYTIPAIRGIVAPIARQHGIKVFHCLARIPQEMPMNTAMLNLKSKPPVKRVVCTSPKRA